MPPSQPREESKPCSAKSGNCSSPSNVSATKAPGFALEFMAGDLSVEEELAYAHRLVDVAQAIMIHANARKRLVINGQAIALAIESAVTTDCSE